jgi:hypothetical protein
VEVRAMTRQQFADIVASDIVSWGKTIRTLGIHSG